MRKNLIAFLPALLVLVAMDANARYIPYEGKAAQKSSISEYDQNNDSYITSNEVEIELREDAVEKAIEMQKQGKSKEEIANVIMDMEDSIEEDAAKIIDQLDVDGDNLVEPDEK